MVFILMVFERWFAVCMCNDGWLALVDLYLICVCGFRMCWRDGRLDDRRCIWHDGFFRFGRVVFDLCMWLSHVLA